MKAAVKRFVVHDLVKWVMPGIEWVEEMDEKVHYKWTQIKFEGPKAN